MQMSSILRSDDPDEDGSDEDTASAPETSSSSEDEHTQADIQSADMRWSQMKRSAQKKRAHTTKGGPNALKGLVSLEDMKRAHGLKRMKDGLLAILTLHSAVELSSICGSLRLKSQQKASMSMSLIIKYAAEEEEINEKRLHNILTFAYEGKHLLCVPLPLPLPLGSSPTLGHWPRTRCCVCASVP